MRRLSGLSMIVGATLFLLSGLTVVGSPTLAQSVECEPLGGGGAAETQTAAARTVTPSATQTVSASVTPSPTGTLTTTPTDTPTGTATNTPTGTLTSTPTDTPTGTATNTPTNSPTDTPTNTPTNTPTYTPTDTPTNTPTFTPTDTPTNTPTFTPTDTPTNTPTNTPTYTPTDTPTSTPTFTPVPPTDTPTSTPTFTPVPPTDTPTSTPTTLPPFVGQDVIAQVVLCTPVFSPGDGDGCSVSMPIGDAMFFAQFVPCTPTPRDGADDSGIDDATDGPITELPSTGIDDDAGIGHPLATLGILAGAGILLVAFLLRLTDRRRT